MSRYNRFSNLSKEELSARGKERYNGMSDEEKRELKGRFYDYENCPNACRLERLLRNGEPFATLHVTTFGLEKDGLNVPIEIGLVAYKFNRETGEYEREKNRIENFICECSPSVLDKAQKNLTTFNVFDYNGLSLSRYLAYRKPDYEVRRRLEEFVREHPRCEILTYNRSFMDSALKNGGFDLPLGTVDLMAVANEANKDSVLFSGKATIPNIAREMGKPNPITALEKACFDKDFIDHTAEVLGIEVGEAKRERREEVRPSDTISLDDIKQTLGDMSFENAKESDGMTASDFGNLFSDRFGAKADVVVGDVQKVGEVNVPHVSESEPYKAMEENLKGNVTEEYLAKICASLETIMKQNEIIMNSLARSGKTLEATKPLDREEEHKRSGEELDKNSRISGDER